MIGLSFRERLLASYHCLSTHGIDTHKFHGSFRLCFRLFCTLFIAYIEIAYSRTCHPATLTNLLCYTPISQIQGKSAYWEFPSLLVVSHTTNQMDYSCTASVYYSPTTRILLLTSLWWYTARHCWRCSSSPTESLLLERISWSSIPNEPISLPSHLSKTEKSLYTELIMFSKLPPGVEPGTIH